MFSSTVIVVMLEINWYI